MSPITANNYPEHLLGRKFLRSNPRGLVFVFQLTNCLSFLIRKEGEKIQLNLAIIAAYFIMQGHYHHLKK